MKKKIKQLDPPANDIKNENTVSKLFSIKTRIISIIIIPIFFLAASGFVLYKSSLSESNKSARESTDEHDAFCRQIPGYAEFFERPYPIHWMQTQLMIQLLGSLLS